MIYFGEWKDLFTIVLLPDPDRDPDQASKDLAHNFHITGATEDYIEV